MNFVNSVTSMYGFNTDFSVTELEITNEQVSKGVSEGVSE